MTRACPTGSGRRARGARDSGTNSVVSTMAASPIGTLIQKIARQSTASISVPPTIGPEAERDADDAAPHADRLRPLPRLGEGVGDDRHRDGVEHRPADRLQARKAISQPSDGARLHSSEPSTNTASPIWNTRRRPSRSAVEPASISRLASTTV